jgi:hypothetical protein
VPRPLPVKTEMMNFVTMIKYTQQYLKKLEDFLKENYYEVRYEKGNFKSGYCILEEKKVVVVNKFATMESRIQALYEIGQMLITQGKVSNDSQHLFTRKGESPASWIATGEETTPATAD